ncbi:DUF4350 domain-containing protein [Antarcticibacterium arcticum]|uniref:DUF4350 domain-containing protein n=1 Tax=Antarcticibacterium arcticum TaxID=2585771 RepID=A0A5B8YM06_9FLAO|nr:DUF4350 domain-containing protein [Antarcticibacterium arcticum]QED37306.1 DUF4350 domain-containing protein [Antarcticibacterium arcticum]
MKNSVKIALGAMLLLVLLLTYLEASEPEPVNWNNSYLETDKIPLGTYVFYESWKNSTPGDIQNIDIPPFEFLPKAEAGTYFFLNNYLSFDDAEIKKLLIWVEAGNTAFLSAGNFSENLLDTLGLKTAIRIPGRDLSSRPRFNLVHPDLKQPENYLYEQEIPLIYFSRIDTLTHTILGVANIKDFKEPTTALPNFLKANHGKGTLYMHTLPQAFSNYFMLSGTGYKYSRDVLAYLEPNSTIYWDRYYKTGKTFYTSPVFVIMRSKTLKWAYYFTLLGVLLFIIFEGKRKQRAVPVIEPLKNQTYEYSRTIANLYLEQDQYKELAQKSIDHFYDHIRKAYRIDTTRSPGDFYPDLAEKSNNSLEDTETLFEMFQNISNKNVISKNDLVALNYAINSYNKST